MRKNLFASIIGGVGLVVAGWIAASPQSLAASSETYRQLNLFGDVFERVRADYVENVDDSDLIESAIQGMLNALDPHSTYLSPKSYKDMQVQTRGEFGGLGIEVTMENGLVKVVAPIDETPAARPSRGCQKRRRSIGKCGKPRREPYPQVTRHFGRHPYRALRPSYA